MHCREAVEEEDESVLQEAVASINQDKLLDFCNNGSVILYFYPVEEHKYVFDIIPPKMLNSGVIFYKRKVVSIDFSRSIAKQIQAIDLGSEDDNEESASLINFSAIKLIGQQLETGKPVSNELIYKFNGDLSEIFSIPKMLKKDFDEVSENTRADETLINKVRNPLQNLVTNSWTKTIYSISHHATVELIDKSVNECITHYTSYLQTLNQLNEQVNKDEVQRVVKYLQNNARVVASSGFNQSVAELNKAIKIINEMLKMYENLNIKDLEKCNSIQELFKVGEVIIKGMKDEGKYHIGYDLMKVIQEIYTNRKFELTELVVLNDENKSVSALKELIGMKQNVKDKKPVYIELDKLHNRFNYIVDIRRKYQQINEINLDIDISRIKNKYNEIFNGQIKLLDIKSDQSVFQNLYDSFLFEISSLGDVIDKEIESIIIGQNGSVDYFVKVLNRYSVFSFKQLPSLERLKNEILAKLKDEITNFARYLSTKQNSNRDFFYIRCYDEIGSRLVQHTFYYNKIEYYNKLLQELSSLSSQKVYIEITQIMNEIKKNSAPSVDDLLKNYEISNMKNSFDDYKIVKRKYNNYLTFFPTGLYDLQFFNNYLYIVNTPLKRSKIAYIQDINLNVLKANDYLRDCLEVYQQIVRQYPQDVLSLAGSALKDVQLSIKALCINGNISNTVTKRNNDTTRFIQNVQILIDKLKMVPEVSSKIDNKVNELQSCDYDYASFNEILDQIENLLTQLKTSNLRVDKYVDNVNIKVIDILSTRLNKAIDIWNREFEYLCSENKLRDISNNNNDDDENDYFMKLPEYITVRKILSQSTTYLVKKNKKQFVLEPSFPQIREQWYDKFASFLQIITALKLKYLLDPLRRDRNDEIIYKVDSQVLSQSYTLLNEHLEDIHEYVKQWLQFHVLWEISVTKIKQRIEDDITKWEEIINNIIQVKNDLKGKTDTIVKIGPSVIQSQSAVDAVSNRYDTILDSIREHYAKILGDETDEFYKIITASKDFLEKSQFNGNASDIPLVVEITKIKKNKNNWEMKMTTINNVDNEVKKKLVNQIQLTQLNGTWNAMCQLYERRAKVYDQTFQKIKQSVNEEGQKIDNQLRKSKNSWKEEKPDENDQPTDALRKIEKYENLFEELDTSYKAIREAKIALDLPVKDDDEIEGTLQDIHLLDEIWRSINGVWKKLELIKAEYWRQCDINTVKRNIENINNNELSELPAAAQQDPSCSKIVESINRFNEMYPILRDISQSDLKERHWNKIFDILHFDFAYNELTIGKLWQSNIKKCNNLIREVIEESQGEAALEIALTSIRTAWDQFIIKTTRFHDSHKLIKEWEELFILLDDHIGTLQAMRQSPFYDIVKTSADELSKKLNDARVLFELWMEVQRQFVYFYGVFQPGSGIQRQLAKAANNFNIVSQSYGKLMQNVNDSLKITNIPNIQKLQTNLESLKSKLNDLRQSLNQYLETQRTAFSRFYFIGDDDLLEIIGNATDPLKLQRHLGKLFAGISSLEIVENDKITHLHSREGEDVDLMEEIKISEYNNVNAWLSQLESNMQKSLAALLDESLTEISQLDEQQFTQFIQKYPSQILLLSTQVHWCHTMEEAFSTKKLESLNNPYQHSVKLLELLADGVLTDLSFKDRKKYEQLITEYVYERDVTKIFIDKKIIDNENVEWENKLKYYYNPKESELLKKLNIKIATSSFYYGFEYLGVPERLVQTPLTDNCYLTLTQALHLRLGGNPFGPAGTGKTETVKALGSQLGRFVLVFNCGENFDFLAMGRIFRGLCQVGAWGCFDEFNRLEERILSAVSQQIQTIQIGLLEDLHQIQMLDTSVVLNPNVGIFITMNPTYAGRSELPDNLKQLFRSFAMITPDWDLISQVMLFSQGFQTSKQLASKIVLLFSLCENQLSSQPHYDFGLRALKSVLVSAGSVKRKKMANVEDSMINRFELKVLLESISQTVVPKLVADDVPLLSNLISYVFPGESLFEIENAEIEEEIPNIIDKYQLTLENSWIKKILQLYQVLEIRHGVMLVGPSGTGKSLAWKVLLEALERIQNIKGEYYIIDPKGMAKDELYGKLDNTTMEWTDGIFTHILRQIVESRRGEDKKRHWIIFDGDVDPEWAENLNSVLDDNKVLTLPNGERLPLNSNVRIIFEVENLKYATLATVSRCGMIWFSEQILSITSYLQNFIKKLTNEKLVNVNKISRDAEESIKIKCTSYISEYFDEESLVGEAIKWVIKKPHIMEVTELRLLNSLLPLLQRGIINIIEYNEENSYKPLTDEQINNYYTKWLLFSLIWGFGGSLSMSKRIEFSNYLASKCVNNIIQLPDDNNTNLIDFQVKLPNGEWYYWKDDVPRIDIEPEQVINTEVVIPTVDTARHQEVIRAWLASHKPVVLCGPPGSGKSMTITSCLKSIDDVEIVSLNFSSATTPDLILKTFNQYCNYQKTPNGAILKPKQDNIWLCIFCDEINLPEQDQYGTQCVISFIRQLVEQNGFWKPKESIWVTLERIQFIGACNPPTDPGRVPLTKRFLTHTAILFVDFPDTESLMQIYSTFNRALLSLQLPLKSLADNLTKAMVQFYIDNQEHFTPDMRSHYIYSPRELSRWTRALYEVLSVRDNMSIEDLVRLFIHESLRLFYDRLVTEEEREWCDKHIDQIALQYFPDTIDQSCLQRPIYYTNWLSKVYESVDKNKLKQHIETRLKTFYEEELDVPLVVFDDMLDHILRIDRVLRQPLGHLLLVGESGVGKTVLSRFVAWMNGLSIFQIKISHKYTIDSFDEDLRNVLRRSGLEDEKICFIFDESNVLSSAFLERMNALLASGDVPGLFNEEDTMKIIKSISKDNKNEENPYQLFLSRVQKNLHIVFTMNPSSGDYNNRTATSPALFNRCVIDWFGTWPREALAQVGSQLIKLDFNEDSYDNNYNQDSDLIITSISRQKGVFTKHDAIINSMVLIHENVRYLCQLMAQKHLVHNFICPRDYLDFIHHYISLFNEKRESLEEQQRYLNTGLLKLRQTEDQVKTMKSNLEHKNKQLQEKQEEAELKLSEMLDNQRTAEIAKQNAEEMSKSLEAKRKEIESAKTVIEQQLAEVEPKVQAAKDNVENIDKRALNEIKSLSKPPENVEKTIAMVGILLHGPKNSTDWKDLKKMMVSGDFISSIVNLDPTKTTKDIIKVIKSKYINDRNFNYEGVYKSSRACAPLYQWVVSQIEYGDILDSIEPMTKKVEGFTAELDILEKQYNKITSELNQLNKKIDSYKREYQDLIHEIDKIKENIQTVSQNVDRSITLVQSLTAERDRWETSTKSFSNELNTLDGDCLLGSAFLAYIGCFNHKNRKILMNDWTNILYKFNIDTKENISLIEYLSKPTTRLEWTTNYSLINDNLYLENAIILNRFIRYPLIIDPSGSCINYLSKLYEKSKLNKSSFLNSSFMKDLESSIRFGYPLLVQDVENIDPILNPLLNKELHKTGGRTLVRIGESDIDFSPTFKLFLTTRDFSFQFSPDISSRVSFVNFTVTPSSLESQTLNKLLAAERPEVEEERNKLLLLEGQYQIQLRELEEKLLTQLNSLEGNILENTVMINTLEEIKKESKDISTQMNSTIESMNQLESVSSLYIPLASLVSHIYFALEQLIDIHFLYQFSLSSYLHLIDKILTPAYSPELSSIDEPEKRIEYLNTQIFDIIYHHISRSLLKKDEIVFALRLIQIKLKGENDDPSELEYDLLYTDKRSSSNISESTKRMIEKYGLKIDENQVQLLNNLMTISQFDYIKADLEKNTDFWEKFITSENPENMIFDSQIDTYTKSEQLRYFRWLIVLKALRPDRLLYGYDIYVKIIFGESFMKSNEDIFDNLTEKTFAEEPILLCSVKGYDPSQKVETYAKEVNKKLTSIALGSSEGFTLAAKAIPQAIREGSYILLRNVHLCPSWLNDLIKMLYSLNNYNSEFRLFMTSEIHPNLPPSLLQISYIIVFEPPDGIRSSLLRSISSIPDIIMNQKPNIRSKLYFLISWIHAIIVERLRYCPVGWTKSYEFNDTDYNCALKTIDEYLLLACKGSTRSEISPEEIRWNALRELLCTSVYGGKVDNSCDEKLLQSIFDIYFQLDNTKINAPLVTDIDNNNNNTIVIIKAPTFNEKSKYIDWIQGLPSKNSPLWLGLPVTAEIRLLQEQSFEVLKNVNMIQDMSSMESELINTHENEDNSVSGKPEWMKILLNDCNEWLSLLVKECIKPERTEAKLSHPLFRFIEREVNIGSELLTIIRNDLLSIIDTINGKIKSTNYIRCLLNMLRKDLIPNEWKNSYRMINTTVSLWLQDFNNRIKQLNVLSNKKLNELLSTPIWLGGLFYPEAYLTATRQTIAQSHNYSLEDLTLKISDDNNDMLNDDEFVLSNLSIEGGEYNDNQLIPSSSIKCPVEKIKMTWCKNEFIQKSEFVEIPLYLNSERTNLILFILVKSELNQISWNERGCSIVAHQ